MLPSSAETTTTKAKSSTMIDAIATVAIWFGWTMPAWEDGWVRNYLTTEATNVVQAGHIHGDVHFHQQHDAHLRSAQRELAAAVHAQWRDEGLRRGLLERRPMPVPWEIAHWSLADYGNAQAHTFAGYHDDTSRLAESFHALPHRRLALLGEAGSGKTVLALLLVLGLLGDPQPGGPVPVLISIASWDPFQEHLKTWFARRLQEEYPGVRRYGRAATEQLVSGNYVMPVLDGLDEAPQQRQGAMLMALNRSSARDEPLVLTCRTEDYARAVWAGGVLSGAAVVQAKPVPFRTIADYIGRAVPPHSVAQWPPFFEQLENQPRGPAAQAMMNPLVVDLAKTVYANSSSSPLELLDPTRFPTRAAVETFLMDALLAAVYHPLPPPPAPGRRRATGGRYELRDVTKWSVSLARHTYHLNSRNFAWWELKYAIPRIVHGLASWLVAIVAIAAPWVILAVCGPSGTDLFWHYAALYTLVTPIIGMRSAYRMKKQRHPIQTMIVASARPVEVSKYGVRLVVRSLAFFAFAMALIPATLAAFGVAILAPWSWIWKLLRNVWHKAAEKVHTQVDPASASSPAKSLRSDRTATLLMIPAFTAAGLLLLSPVFAWKLATEGLWQALPVEMLSAGVGYMFGVIFLLDSAWWHFVVARSWAALRRRLPWRLMHYLEDAHERGVLRQAGAVLQFRHARLHDRLLYYR